MFLLAENIPAGGIPHLPKAAPWLIYVASAKLPEEEAKG
jgi:hypothetical protein